MDVNGAASGLGLLEAASPLAQKWLDHQLQAHVVHLTHHGLSLAPTAKKVPIGAGSLAVARARAANRCWLLDFTSDALMDGRLFRTLNVLDDNRQLLGVESNFSLPAARVVQVLTRLVECHGRLAQLRTDNDPEFISARLTEWCGAHAMALHWIQLGKPTQNAYTERLQ